MWYCVPMSLALPLWGDWCGVGVLVCVRMMYVGVAAGPCMYVGYGVLVGILGSREGIVVLHLS